MAALPALLPYTDGSDGNGITDVRELLRYLEQHAIRLYHADFLHGYAPLLRAAAVETLALFDDARATTAEVVRDLTADLYRILWPETHHAGELAAKREASTRETFVPEGRKQLCELLRMGVHEQAPRGTGAGRARRQAAAAARGAERAAADRTT
jgi:hypothetical protein